MSRCSFLTLTVLLAAGLAGCGGGDGAGPGGQQRDAAQAERGAQTSGEDAGDEAADDEPAGEATSVPDPTPEGELPPIQVTSPAAFANVHRSFVLAGSAMVHEGTLAWAILDADLRPMVRGTTTTTCGAPCRGRFRARVSLARVPVGSWELHVWSPNVADEGPARLHDTMVPISVTDRPVDAPAPDAIPPGGVPG